MNETLTGIIVGGATALSIYIYKNNEFSKNQKVFLLLLIIFFPAQIVAVILIKIYNNYKKNQIHKQSPEYLISTLTELKNKGIISPEEFKDKVYTIHTNTVVKKQMDSEDNKKLKELYKQGILTYEEYLIKTYKNIALSDEIFNTPDINTENIIEENEKLTALDNNKYDIDKDSKKITVSVVKPTYKPKYSNLQIFAICFVICSLVFLIIEYENIFNKSIDNNNTTSYNTEEYLNEEYLNEESAIEATEAMEAIPYNSEEYLNEESAIEATEAIPYNLNNEIEPPQTYSNNNNYNNVSGINNNTHNIIPLELLNNLNYDSFSLKIPAQFELEKNYDRLNYKDLNGNEIIILSYPNTTDLNYLYSITLEKYTSESLNITYKRIKNDFFVIKGETYDYIIYQKCIITSEGLITGTIFYQKPLPQNIEEFFTVFFKNFKKN